MPFLDYKMAFATCIATISNDCYAIDSFSADFTLHKSAVDNIRPILSERDQRKLQKAWNEYTGKDKNLGMSGKEYVAAMSAMSVSTNNELFDEFKKNFINLHGCLDNLLK